MKKASEEVAEDEAEFDEEAKADDGLGTLMKQLTAVEKYALKHVSHTQRFWKESQLAAVDAEIEAQKEEFDARKLEEMAENLGVSTANSTETEEESEESGENSDDSDDDSDNGSDSDEEDNTESTTEESEAEEVDGENMPLSPRTRSRGDVRINLWNLDE